MAKRDKTCINKTMQKIFIFGRPGSGKSTVVNIVSELAKATGTPITHVNDYDILFAMYRGEMLSNKPANERRFRSSIPEDPAAGFDVVNPMSSSAWDEAVPCLLELFVQSIAQHDRTLAKSGIMTIEFARRNHRELFKKFSLEFLANSHFWLVEAPVAECINRIRERAEARGDKFIGASVLNGYYGLDNLPLLAGHSIAGRKVACMQNSGITLEELHNEVARLWQLTMDTKVGMRK